MKESGSLSFEAGLALLQTLEARFRENMGRHEGHEWAAVKARLENRPEKLWALSEMQRTGGEPDAADFDTDTREYIFFDCCEQSPAGRRSLCYDGAALAGRKTNKPAGSAVEAAAAMGAQLLTQEQYLHLQTLGAFDTKTSSWVQTPPDVREPGGALFCDRRYGRVFVYHNSAESYYAVRGFRCALWV